MLSAYEIHRLLTSFWHKVLNMRFIIPAHASLNFCKTTKVVAFIDWYREEKLHAVIIREI